MNIDEIQYISVRITLKEKPKETIKQMTTFITKINAHKHIFALEDTDNNPHLQGSLVFNKINKIQRIRNIFKKCFPHLKGNENYSIKTTYKSASDATVLADYKLKWYCCKGVSDQYLDTSNPTINYTNYTKDEIKAYHKSYWDTNKSINLLKVAKKQNSRKTTTDFYLKAYHEMYDQLEIKTLNNPKPGRLHNSGDGVYRNDNDWIKTKLVGYHVKNKIIFSRNRFQNTFCFILSRANPTAYQAWIEEQIEFI